VHPSAETPAAFFGRLVVARAGWHTLNKTYKNDLNLANFNELLEEASHAAHDKEEISKAAKANPEPPQQFKFTPTTWIDPHLVHPLVMAAILWGSYATVYRWKCPPTSVSDVTRGTNIPECGQIAYVIHDGLPQLIGPDVPVDK